MIKLKFNFSNRYRIVEDDYNGFEVQVKRWYFPFWLQLWEDGTTNTHPSISDAKILIEKHKENKVSPVSKDKEIWRDR